MMFFSRSPRRRGPTIASTTTPTLSALAVFLPLIFVLAASPRNKAAATAAADSSLFDALPPMSQDDIGANDGSMAHLLGSILDTDDPQKVAADGSLYEPEFSTFDQSIVGRAPPGVTALANNVPEKLNVLPGSTQVFVFEGATIFARDDEDEGEDQDPSVEGELRKRDVQKDTEEEDVFVKRAKKAATRQVFLSANTCIQPQALSTKSDVAPQLAMYVSTSENNISPGPLADADKQKVYPFTEGAVMVKLNVTSDVYIGIAAANISSKTLSGMYNFEVAASRDGWYHSYDNETDANLIWVDSDANASLLITHNLTDGTDPALDAELMARQPYVMFAQNEAYDQAVRGVRFSYCGLQTYAQIAATTSGKFTSMVATSMTRAGLGNHPKQQFYFSGLNASSKYMGILVALPANGTAQAGTANLVGGGGKVTQATSFETKTADASCQVVLNLAFCNETAYAVPSSRDPTRFANATMLARAYDDYAAGVYANFKKVMAQIPCEAPTTQRYSLVRNCDDCAQAYKNWLCSVAIPRCTDFADNSTWLQPRAIGQPLPGSDGARFLDSALLANFPNTTAFNSSRNPFIDQTILPGPYKEVLPCDDLCYNLVQSCPAAMGFACPRLSHIGFKPSYGRRASAEQNGLVTCNYPGSAHFYSGGPARASWSWWAMAAAAAAGTATVLF